MKLKHILTLFVFIASALAHAQNLLTAITSSSSVTSTPKTLIKPEVTNISIDSMGDLKWKISGYDVSGQVEEFKNNKWLRLYDFGGMMSMICELPARKNDPVTKSIMPYSIRVKFHKGLNRYRIRITAPVEITSDEILLNSSMANDDNSVWIINQHIILGANVYYEVINSNGLTLLKGTAKEIDVSSLQKGDTYYLYTKKETKKFVR